VLHPQTPSQVAKDQVQIKLKWDEENTRKRKEEQPLMVKEDCKEVSVSSKRLAKKESHFALKKIPFLDNLHIFSFVNGHLLALPYLLSLRLFLK